MVQNLAALIMQVLERSSRPLSPAEIASSILKIKPDLVPQPVYNPAKRYSKGDRLYHTSPRHEGWFVVQEADEIKLIALFDDGRDMKLTHWGSWPGKPQFPVTAEAYLACQIETLLTNLSGLYQRDGLWHNRPIVVTEHPFTFTQDSIIHHSFVHQEHQLAMTTIDQFRNIINQAMRPEGALRMYYQNNNGRTSIRVVEPIEWENEYVFRAYCYLREEERNFKLTNILETQYFHSAEEALKYANQPLEALPEPSTVRPAQSQVTVRRFEANTQQAPPSPTFGQVTLSDQWSRLLNYYAECLVHEYQQQYILNIDSLLPVEVEQVRRFLQGEITLEFKFGYRPQQNPIARFIETNRRRLQLCLGYPFLVISSEQVAPLLFTPVEISEGDHSFVLRAEGFEVSYAALRSLRMTEEEIEAFLDECDRIQPQAGQSLVQALEGLILTRINEIYQTEIQKRKDRFEPVTIFDGPALFWVEENKITGNLILELKDLASPEHWEKASTSLHQLLGILPDHDYPPAPEPDQDNKLYVTAINQQQLRAAHAARSESVLAVTGPPGTGKSQLVLNLVAQAFLNGETVLFASRNNRAVDVVMNRLQNELKFQGAVRTGNNQNREKAVQQMRAALNNISTISQPLPSNALWDSYHTIRQKALQAQEQLEQVRKLTGLLLSYQKEQEQYLGFLPAAVTKFAEDTVPVYKAAEAESLQSTLSSFLENALRLKETKAQLERRLVDIVADNATSSALISEFQHYEDQWGSFGGGFLGKRHFDQIEALHSHLQAWLDLIDVIELLDLRNRYSTSKKQLIEQLSQEKERLPNVLLGQVETLASRHLLDDLGRSIGRFVDLEKQFTRIVSNQLNLWEKLIYWLSRGAPLKKKVSQFITAKNQLGIQVEIPEELLASGTEGLAVACAEIQSLLKSAIFHQKLTQIGADLEKTDQALLTRNDSLPEPARNDLGMLEKFDFDNKSLRGALLSIQSEASQLQSNAIRLAERINAKLEGNQDELEMIQEFKNSPARKDQRLWHLRIPAEPEPMIQHVTKWHNLVSFWSAEVSVKHLQEQLASLPTESQAIENVKTTSEELLQLSGEIIRAAWLDRARQASNEVIQGVHDYVATVEELTGEYNPLTYQRFKSIEKANLHSAVQVFPIWATTNLAAKTNFPLMDGYFDIIIIDEGSQCDIPSALPLLYRAKRIVIIGDPNQLRHVATLKKDADQELAAKYGIGLDAFSYNTLSLFDIAQRSAGNHPGTLLLNEHYRSDPRIIGFSNQEFYNNELIIKTDLSVWGIRKTFLNNLGGIFWIQVEGQAEYPEGGSVVNGDELLFIQELLPRLMDSLNRHDMGQASIGIVTPYRAQEKRIQAWVNSRYGATGHITVGTAHKFQGDERDFMIFSPVLARGMSNGSLHWLQRTKNLLNVAVTRARITLIVVGDWDYCQVLSEDHCFRHLAEYLNHQGGRVIRDLEELPLFGKQAPEIIGVITDPHNPEYNRTTLRRFISSCTEFVWWIDPYFTNHVFDLFWDVFQDSKVNINEIRLLTAREQLESGDDRKPQLSVQRFNRLQKELALRGGNIELRIMERRNLPHDRLLYTPGQAINMPPFAGAYGDHRHVSEYTQSRTNRDLFAEYWKKAAEVNST